ncbi:MAG: HD domain-containing protein [Deltaproteobacteria bacterium]|jgi:putative hydrolase of HD superfamily|nr:HD domain-containing protein [Deltaproteobacteria bacterium]
MLNIRKSLLQFVFAGSYMKRWNDKLRPMEFIEADKQAHKMIVAWILCRLNGGPSQADRLALEQEVVERGIFDYFFRLVITDIKPPVYYRIKTNPKDYAQLVSWVLSELEPLLRPLDAGGAGGGFWSRLVDYIREPDRGDLAAHILDAAHNYASSWELGILSPMNHFDPEMPDIEADFKKKLAARMDLAGLSEMVSEPRFAPPGRSAAEQEKAERSALGGFAKLCGQLRFQKRWSQTPRVPETSVMGHMLMVACYAYFFSLAVEACPARKVNNYFCALFHDLPEVLTRDIISPVKKSSDSLSELVREYENEELERRVFAPLRAEGYADLVDRLGYYLGVEVGSEFTECVRLDDGGAAGSRPSAVSFEDLQTRYNQDIFDPKDGKLLKACDNIAAFIEAYTAVRNGISSDQLHQAIWRIRSENSKLEIGGVHVGALLADFT